MKGCLHVLLTSHADVAYRRSACGVVFWESHLEMEGHIGKDWVFVSAHCSIQFPLITLVESLMSSSMMLLLLCPCLLWAFLYTLTFLKIWQGMAAVLPTISPHDKLLSRTESESSKIWVWSSFIKGVWGSVRRGSNSPFPIQTKMLSSSGYATTSGRGHSRTWEVLMKCQHKHTSCIVWVLLIQYKKCWNTEETFMSLN